MTYYKDLSPYEDSHYSNGRILNIGWLSSDEAFPTGEVSDEFINRLWLFCEFPVIRHRGFHHCGLCQGRAQRGPLVVKHGADVFKLGFSVIFVFGASDTAYAAPDLIVHYVSAHRYQPPQGFITAVTQSELPLSEAYRLKVESMKSRRN